MKMVYLLQTTHMTFRFMKQMQSRWSRLSLLMLSEGAHKSRHYNC